MAFDVRVIDDLMRVATGALGTAASLRQEARSRMRDRFEQVLSRMDVVTRDEFEVVRAMAATARDEQETLAERLAALELRLAELSAPAEAGTRRRVSGEAAAGTGPKRRPASRKRVPAGDAS